jgi:hypothetical protein
MHKHTDKKENYIFPIYIYGNSDRIGWKVIYEEGFLIYEEKSKYLTIYEEVVSHIAPDPFSIP